MKKQFLAFATAVTFAVTLPVFAASTPKGGIIYTFKGGSDGENPVAPLVADAHGNLYGTTQEGGGSTFCNGGGCGTVFELIAPSSPAGKWGETILHSFTGGNDGSYPFGGLIFDSAGNLYGTTYEGGDMGNTLCTAGKNVGCGTIFELSPPKGPGGAWSETVLHLFEEGGADGAFPLSSLVFDNRGNLYGTTLGGNTFTNGGIVFELSPGSGGLWTESVLYSFMGLEDGYVPEGPLVFDGSGNLYGTTNTGSGDYAGGAVFQLVPPIAGGSWAFNSLYDFEGPEGGRPVGGLLIDHSGNFFGTTMFGGTQRHGVAFELIPPQSGGSWTDVDLYNFVGGSDAYPFGFVEDAAGNLYGTAEGTYDNTCGEIFKLSNSAGSWNRTVLHGFTSKHFGQGCYPQAPLVYGKWKALYGTTSRGGDKSCGVGCGTVFGFLP